MKLDKALLRDKKHKQARHGMRVNGRSVFLIQEVLVKRGTQAGGTQAESAGGKRKRTGGKRRRKG